MWSENGPCCGTIAYLLVKKEGTIWFTIICLKLYQFERITWLCLSILKCILESAMQSVMLEIQKKIHDLSKFSLDPLLAIKNSRRPWNCIHSNPPCRTPCRLFIHEVLFGALSLHLRRSALGRSPPFRPMRTLRLQWSRAFSLVCEVGPKEEVVVNLLTNGHVAHRRRRRQH